MFLNKEHLGDELDSDDEELEAAMRPPSAYSRRGAGRETRGAASTCRARPLAGRAGEYNARGRRFAPPARTMP